jgi:hypothetical protein
MAGKLLIDPEPHDRRWPLDRDEWGDQLFCCESVVPGKSYCAFHRELSLLPMRRPARVLEPVEPACETIWMSLNAAESTSADRDEMAGVGETRSTQFLSKGSSIITASWRLPAVSHRRRQNRHLISGFHPCGKEPLKERQPWPQIGRRLEAVTRLLLVECESQLIRSN